MLAIRVPCSALGGALFSGALFLGLAQLVNVPFEIGERILADPVVFKPPRVDTPVVEKRDPQVVHEPPIVEPRIPYLVVDDGGPGVDPVRYTRPTLDPRPGPRHIGLRGVDGDVIPVVRPTPDYPPSAIRTNTEGWVRVQFSVTSIGTVRDAQVVDSEPGTTFDEAALKAIARWRYNPRVENGEAVERVGLQTIIRFELEK